MASRNRISKSRRDPLIPAIASRAVRPLHASRLIRSTTGTMRCSLRPNPRVDSRRTTIIGPKKSSAEVDARPAITSSSIFAAR